MKSIREGVFETNSSSMHSITFSSKESVDRLNYLEKHSTPATLGYRLKWKAEDYGWEEVEYTDPQNKFSYYLAALYDYLQVLQREEIFKRLNNKNYRWLFSSKADHDSYIRKFKECGSQILPDEINVKYIRKLAYNIINNLYNYFIYKHVGFSSFHYWDANKATWVTTDNPDNFLGYLITSLINSNDYNNNLTINCLVDFDGSIDHQSAPSEDVDCKILASSSPEEVYEWVFGDGSFKTGNDNG